MRKLLVLVVFLLTSIPVSAVMINEPSFKFKATPWLKDLKIAENGTFAVCCNDEYLYLFNSSKILWKKELRTVCVDIRGKYIALADIKGNVYLYNNNGKLIWKRKIEPDISSIAVSSNGRVIVGGDKKIQYFDENGKMLWEYKTVSYVAKVAICDNGNVAVAEDMLGNLYFFVKCNKDVCGSFFCQKDWTWEYRNQWYIGKFTRLNLAYPFIVKISDDGNHILVNGGEMRVVYIFNKFGYLTMKIMVDGLPISVATTSNMDTIAIGCDNVLFPTLS